MHDKHWGNKLGVPEFIQAVVGFFDNGSRMRRALAGRFIEMLQPLRDMMADQSLYRFYARSVEPHLGHFASTCGRKCLVASCIHTQTQGSGSRCLEGGHNPCCMENVGHCVQTVMLTFIFCWGSSILFIYEGSEDTDGAEDGKDAHMSVDQLAKLNVKMIGTSRGMHTFMQAFLHCIFESFRHTHIYYTHPHLCLSGQSARTQPCIP
jgi:hypothetical protein